MILATVAVACARRRWAALLVAALLAIGCLRLIQTRLSVTTDTSTLFASSLPWKQRAADLEHAFPGNEDLLVAVVDAAIPEEAEMTARDLAAALRTDTLHFSRVSQPDDSPYLERNAFLFLDPPVLQDVLDSTIDAQPFLSRLVADPSLRGLTGAFSLIAQGIKAGHTNLDPFMPALKGFEASLAAAARESPCRYPGSSFWPARSRHSRADIISSWRSRTWITVPSSRDRTRARPSGRLPAGWNSCGAGARGCG